MRSHWNLVDDPVVIALIIRIQESVLLQIYICPHALSFVADLEAFPLPGGIAKERAKAGSIYFSRDVLQERFVELKLFWKLDEQLAHAVKILDEDW